LQSALNNTTDVAAEKLAPMTNSQWNETLNSVIGSKNPKIRFYGGSDSTDPRVACGVAQTNLRYSYISRTLEESLATSARSMGKKFLIKLLRIKSANRL